MNAMEIVTRTLDDLVIQKERVALAIMKLADDYLEYRMHTYSFKKELAILKAQHNAYETTIKSITQHCNEYDRLSNQEESNNDQ